MSSAAVYPASDMTFAPPTLVDLAEFWTANGGVNLGIVGDAAHTAGGTSYHLGRDDLRPDAYSIRTARDKAGLSNAASAIDLGRFNGSLLQLRDFSKWLVGEGQRNAPGTRDIREIIYSDDGSRVLRWDRERGFASAPQTGEADNSHLTHTHISYYRDSEMRDKRNAFRGWNGFMIGSDDMRMVTTILPFGGTYKIPPGTSARGIRLDAAGNVAGSKTVAGPHDGTYDALVGVSTVTGNPFIRPTDPALAGYLVSSAVVVETVNPPPAPDCTAEVAAAVVADRAKAHIVYS